MLAKTKKIPKNSKKKFFSKKTSGHMAQWKPQIKFERNPCNNFRDKRCYRRTTDEFRFHELCWHSQAELKIEHNAYCPFPNVCVNVTVGSMILLFWWTDEINPTRSILINHYNVRTIKCQWIKLVPTPRGWLHCNEYKLNLAYCLNNRCRSGNNLYVSFIFRKRRK